MMRTSVQTTSGVLPTSQARLVVAVPQVLNAYCQNEQLRLRETRLLHEGRLVKDMDTFATVRMAVHSLVRR
jgi:hypothetical protein